MEDVLKISPIPYTQSYGIVLYLFLFFFCVKIALYRRYRSYYRFDRKSVIATLLEFDLQTLNVMEYNDTILKKQTN